MQNNLLRRAMWMAIAGATLSSCAQTVSPQTRPLPFSARLTLGPTVPTAPLPEVAIPAQRLHLQSLAGTTLAAKILVVSADGNEADLPAITATLQAMGTPYDVWIANKQPGGLTPAVLASGTQGLYQGVILTTGNLPVQVNGVWQSALSAQEWQNLWSYEANFGVKQVSWYTFPTADYGFGAATARDTTANPLAASFTPAGAAAFPSLQTAKGLTIANAYTYMAKTNGANVTPWLQDASGNALIALTTYADGRQNVALTFDSNQYLVHSRALGFGLINWLTSGVFLGDRLTVVSEQVDDMFIDDDMWVAGGATGGADRAYRPAGTPGGAPTFRLSGDDLRAYVAWQKSKRNDPQLPGLATTLAFNGWGTTADFIAGGIDTLTPAARQTQDQFYWISHTWDHQNLDATDIATTTSELQQNNTAAAQLGLSIYSARNLVQPDVSGLKNALGLKAAYDTGVRFVISDTSHPDQTTSVANTGIVNALVPGIFELPRHPVNLYYNVSTPAEWVSEYNTLYHTYWGRDLTYAEILDKTSDQLVSYMLGGDIDPWMFHQPNMRAYDGTHSLLGDLSDMTFAKYANTFATPVLFPTQDQLGTYMQGRMAYLAAKVKATIVSGNSITLSADQNCVAPVCGPYTANAQWMGDHWVTYVPLQAGQSVTLALGPTHTPPASPASWPGAAPDRLQPQPPPSATPAPATPSPAVTPTPGVSTTPASTPSPTPSVAQTPTPSVAPSPVPTVAPSAKPSTAPTPGPTARPSGKPSAKPKKQHNDDEQGDHPQQHEH
jgi:hypothetical protein